MNRFFDVLDSNSKMRVRARYLKFVIIPVGSGANPTTKRPFASELRPEGIAARARARVQRGGGLRLGLRKERWKLEGVEGGALPTDGDRLHGWACETRTRKCQFGLSI